MAKGPVAKCPFCNAGHRTKEAFNKCKNRHGKWSWTKDGDKVFK